MSNAAVTAFAWFGLVVHVAVAIVAWRRPAAAPLVPLVNLVVALSVIAYWIPRWISYITRNIQWQATDQLVPLFAILVCLLAAVGLSGRYTGNWPHRMVFAVDAAVFALAVLYFSLARFTRLF